MIKKIGADCLLPIENCLKHLPRFELDERRIRAFMNGLPTTIHAPDEKVLRIFSGEKFLGVGRIERGELRSSKIIT
ncbi:MAG: tRNA pseudouridine(55) synthase TruB [Selenomonadaceae bacterium]|nr:tRNA pseudouridine(55) synthase TruB [Selenomonadaceae bacterium]